MLDTTVQTATEQPAQVAQISSEKKGAANTSQNDFARSIAAKQAPAFAKAVAEVKQEAKAEAPVTEEAKAPAAEVPEETKTEAQAEPAEATEETEEVLSPETPSLDPKLQEKINRRIGKEVAKTKKEIAARVAAETELTRLREELAQRQEAPEKEVPVPVSAEIPLAHITTPQALSEYEEALTNDIIEAEGLLYTDFPPEGKQTKWGVMTKDTLIAALTQAKKDARTAIPARRDFLTKRTQSTQSAHEKFPFLKDPTHPGYQMAKQALRDNPVLRAYPNTDYLVGLIVKGQLADQAEAKPEAKAPAKPKPQPTKGQSEIASDASITRAPTGVMNQNALQAEIAKITGGKKSLGHKDFAQVLLAKQRFRNSQ
jgi:hypothetical protein